MKVLIVCNNLYIKGNGICTSAVNTGKYLREAGVEVKYLTSVSKHPEIDGEPDFPLKRMYFPVFQPIIDANGFCYAVRDRKMIEKAVAWCDIVHIEEPLVLEHDVIREAEKQGKKIVGTFHLYTQNILSEIPLANGKWVNALLMRDWRKNFFDHCSDVTCPTETVRRLLVDNGFKSRLHVISNGIKVSSHPITAEAPQTDPYLILNIGRLATKKGQITLLEAMEYSRHAGEIKLYFAGNGVMESKLKALASKLLKKGILKHPPVFAFHSHAELMRLARKAYLYVHCANIEVEGLGCMEAFREGTVPVIAKGPLIATSDFAMDDRSTFPSGDARTLAERIDWWIEHPQERLEMGQKYADKARECDIHKSIEKLIGVYENALKG